MSKGKGQRRVFVLTESQRVLTTIGEKDYVIEPQPISRYAEFTDVLFNVVDSARTSSNKNVVEWLLEMPHKFLQLFIPDITEEDAATCSLPQLKWLWETIREVNGIDWLEGLIKNVLGRLSQMAEATGQVTAGEQVSGGAITKTTDTDGVTPST